MEKIKLKFRIVLSATGLPGKLAIQGAKDITEEFTRRPWHQNVSCSWDNTTKLLILRAENDYDKDGLALMDEFSDCICACFKEAGDVGIQVVSITKLDELN